jgi:hypothetical protein
LRLDVRDFARRRLLHGASFGWQWRSGEAGAVRASISVTTSPGRMTLDYVADKVPMVETLRISSTACHFGGSRVWFHCPRCSRRVAVLFLRSRRFVCRPCGGIAYASQSEDEFGRGWRRQSRLEARLRENWQRPKGMHWATYERLLAAIWDCEEKRDAALLEFVGKWGDLG